MKKILLTILTAIALSPITASAVPVTVPSATAPGDILYGLSSGKYTILPIGAEGTCLGVSSSLPAYITCATGGGSGSGTWSTTTSTVSGQLINYSNNTTDIVTIGSNSTTTAKFFFDPNTNRFIVTSGNVGIGTTTPATKLQVGSGTTGMYFNDTNGTFQIGTAVPKFGAVSVNMNLTGASYPSGFHAFEDWSTINLTGSVGYASFDAQPTITGTSSYGHLVGFQSRPIYSGSGGVTSYFDSINSYAVHNGSGVVANARGLRISDVGGTGEITNDYGIFIDQITRGTTNNYALYAAGGKNYFADSVGIGVTNPLLNKGLTIAASTTNAAISTGLRIYQGGAGVGTGATIELGYSNNSIYSSTISGLYNGSGQALTFGTNIIGNAAVERMRIDHNGNVGIGTTSPYAKLSVEGSSALGNTATAGYFVATTTATSTFAGGIKTNLLNITSTTASSTFANGINLTSGCYAVNGVCITGGGGGTAGPVTTTLEASCEPQTDSTDFAPGGAYWQPIYGWTFTNATSSRIMCNVAIPKNLAATPNISIMPYLSATSSAGTGIGIVDVSATSTGMGQNWYTTNYTDIHAASTTASKRWALTMGTSLPLTSTTTITLAGLVTLSGGDILKFEITRYGEDANDTVENDLFIPKVLVQLDTN